MTDFIRNILVNATVNAANAAAANASVSSEAAVKAEMAKPINQIQIPAAVAPLATSECALPVEKQRLIKVEILQETATTTASTMAVTDAGKAQRAARRDVVNARRDKRKAMAQSASSVPSSPMEMMTSCGGTSSDSEVEFEDKSKKMKTSRTSSLAVVGGLAVSENSVKKPSLSSTMPPTPGLLFTPEIDAAGEERLRAMEAQLETLDPDSKEAKKKRRLIRNRMSAQLHRERKKAYVGQLEDQLMEKDRELKLLQEKMAKMMEDTEKLKSDVEKTKTLPPTQPTSAPAKPTPATKAPVTKATKKNDDEVVIKEEPQSWDSPWPLDAAETWDLHGLEDSEMADLETADLLRDFDDPFAGLGGAEYADLCKPHHEIHAAKKNLAMMAAVMFSVSFFGNSPSFYNVTPGSSFSSTFGAQPPKEFSQMSIASRIVACLEKTSWKEFRDVSSWISARTADAAHAKEDAEKADETDEEDAVSVQPVSSPSAASDVTDTTGSTCGSPARMIDDCLDDASMTETDLIDEFEYPVEDPFGAGAGADWLVDENDVNRDTHKKQEFLLSDFVMSEELPKPKLAAQAKSSSSISSRLYESLTALWREKNQVLLTVRNDKQQVLQRSIADMSTIRDGLQSGNFFTKVFGDNANQESNQEDQSVTFLYPMSAFSSEAKPLISENSRASDTDAAVDPVFLEVSCQMNGAVAASQM